MAAPPCDCGKPSVMQTVSKQTANQGRKFFCCGQKASERRGVLVGADGHGHVRKPLTAAGDGPVDLTGDDRPLSNPNGAGPSGVNGGGAARGGGGAAAAAAARRAAAAARARAARAAAAAARALAAARRSGAPRAPTARTSTRAST